MGDRGRTVGPPRGRGLLHTAVALGIASAIALGAPLPAQAGGRYQDWVFGGLTLDHNVVYGHAPDSSGHTVDLTLDLYQPQGDVAPLRPVLIYAHGGAFTKGNKESGHDAPYAENYALRGFVSASIDYRLDRSEQEATDDMQAAVRWFKAHALEYRVDPSRIAVMGSSSGAIMALSTALAPEDPGASGNPGYSSDVAAAVSISGTVEHPETITPGDPPIVWFHARDDTTIPYAAAVANCQQIQAEGNVCELHTKDTGGHPPGFAIANRDEFAAVSSEFMVRREAIDVTQPTTNDDVPSGYSAHPVSVALTAADRGGSGPYRTYYTTGADPAAPTTDSVVYDPSHQPVLGDGERISYFSVDRAGNAEQVRTSAPARVDATPPRTSDDVPADYRPDSVTVTLTAADEGGSGIAHTYYTTGSDPPAPTTGSPEYDPDARPVLADGERISYFSTDAAGNAEPVRTSSPARVDGDPPSSTASAVRTTTSPTIAVEYTASDAGAGVDHVALYAKPAGQTGYSEAGSSTSGRFSYSADAGPGDYSFYTVAYDRVGHAEPAPQGPDAVTTLVPRTVAVEAASRDLSATTAGGVRVPLANRNPFEVTGRVRLLTARRVALHPGGPRRVRALGAGSFSIPATGSGSVSIALPNRLRQALARRGALPVRMTSMTGGAGGELAGSALLRLRAAAFGR